MCSDSSVSLGRCDHGLLTVSKPPHQSPVRDPSLEPNCKVRPLNPSQLPATSLEWAEP